MDWLFPFLIFILALTSAMSVAITVYALRHRRTPGAMPFAMFMLAIASWTFTYAIELNSPTLVDKIFWLKISYLGVVTLPAAWLIFALQFTGHEKWNRPARMLLLSLEPALILILVWTNDLHHLFWQQLEPQLVENVYVLNQAQGILFWLNLTYSYILIIYGVFLMLRAVHQGSHLSRPPIAAIFVGMLAPLLINLFSLTDSIPLSNVILTPFGFFFTDIAVLWAMVSFQFLEIVPLANQYIIESMGDGLVILDIRDKIVYLNPTACRILNRSRAELMGQPANQLLPDWSSIQDEQASGAVSDQHWHKEIMVEVESRRSYYELQITTLNELSGLMIGRVLLWHDITKRKIAEQESKTSQERLKQLVENSPNPIFSIDSQGIIQTWNHACVEIFQYGPEIIGQKYHKILYKSQDQNVIEEKLERVFREGMSFTNAEMAYLCQDGSIRRTTSRLYPLFDPFGNIESCVLANTDISERIEAEQVLRRQLEELTVLHAVAAACAEADEENALIERVTQIIGDGFFPDNFGLILLEEGSNLLSSHPSYREKPGAKNAPYPLGTGITGRVALEGKPLRVADISQNRDYFVVDQNTRSELCVPLKAGDRVIGVINAESSRLDAFSANDERLLSILADQIAVAIERLRDGASARQRVQELLAISRISHEITSRLDRQQVLDSIVRHAAQISNSAASGLFLYQSDSQLRLVATYGVGDEFIKQINTSGVPIKGTAVGRAMTTRRPFQINDVHEDSSYATLAVAELENILSILALPMLRGDEVIGGIVIWDRKARIFTPEEEGFLQALANQSVNAIENSRLFEAERQGRKMAEALRETGSELSATLDYESVLDRLLDQAARLAPYDAANVMLVEEGHIQVARASGYEQFGQDFASAIDNLHLRVFGTDILRQMSDSRQPLIIEDASNYTGWEAVDNQVHLRSWLCAPVMAQDQIIAFFTLEKVEAGFYQAEHAELLSIFAGQTSLALQNARLFAETRRRAAQQEALNKIIAAAVVAPDLPDLLEAVLDLSLVAFGLDMGSLWVSGHHALRGLPGEIGESSAQLGQQTGGNDLTRLAIKDWKKIRDAHPLAIWKDHMRQFQVRATLLAPVLAAGKRIGALSLASSTPKDWSPDEIALAEAIGKQIGSATERLDLLSKTREQAQQVQQIIDTVPEGVILLDADHKIVLVNPAAQEQLEVLLGGEFLDRPIFCLGDQPVESFLVPDSGKSWHELQTESAPGQIFEVAARPLEVNAQEGGLVLVLRDVTIERENRTQIQMQERLATVGQLAAGIAHDFNNIMAAIVVYTDLLIMDQNLTQTNQEQLRIIQQQVQRATSLIRQILDFSRRAVIEQIPLDLLPFIKELDKLLIRVLPENIHLEFSFQPGVYFVKADPTRLQQAVMNLALNGRDAMPMGGSLHFDLERVNLRPGEELPLPDLTPGNWIRLTVKDNGAGIPAEILPHIFDPFFTTKPVGKGTGLGLAQAYGIIKQHGGCIAVHSEIGGGASFIIYLPAVEMPEDEIPETPPEMLIQGEGENVLIVEDDPAARLALISLLESQNYRALEAQNGVHALEVFDQEQGAINLVVSDVVMPEMGGVDLYKALLAKKPSIKMLFITGHPLDFKDQVILETGRAEWLQKPFSVLEFTSVLRTMLQDIP